MAVAIIGILTTLFFPEIGSIRARAEKVVCAGHLRSLHVSFGAYLNDNEQWPQCPETNEGADEDQFWIDALKDYGATEDVWLCPSQTKLLGGVKSSTSEHKIHYSPTQFNDNPLTPRKWPSQPWLIELTGPHPGGNLLIRADGAIQNASELWNSAG